MKENNSINLLAYKIYLKVFYILQKLEGDLTRKNRLKSSQSKCSKRN